MKKTNIIFFIFSIIIFYSCNCQKGSGKVETKDILVGNFNSIEISGTGKVYLSYSAATFLKIKTDDNIFELIETNVSSDKLSIKSKECFSNVSELTYYIGIPDLKTINISGSIEILNEDTLNVNELAIKSSGSGIIKLILNARKLNIKTSGSSDINLAGSALENNIEISGSGNVEAFNLKSKESEIEISGAGNCNVYVNDILKANVSGSGNIIYKGNPQDVDTKVTGSGRINSDNNF